MSSPRAEPVKEEQVIRGDDEQSLENGRQSLAGQEDNEEIEPMEPPQLFGSKKRVFIALNKILATVRCQWLHIALFWLLLVVNYLLLILVLVDRIWLRKQRDGAFFEASCIITGMMSGVLVMAFFSWLMTTHDSAEERKELENQFPSVRLIDYSSLTFVALLSVILYFPMIAIFCFISTIKSPNPNLCLEIFSLISLVLEIIYSAYLYYYHSILWQQDIERIRILRYDLLENRMRDLEEGISARSPPPNYMSLIQKEEASPPHYSQLER